jgi:hypothetical protein
MVIGIYSNKKVGGIIFNLGSKNKEYLMYNFSTTRWVSGITINLTPLLIAKNDFAKFSKTLVTRYTLHYTKF